MNQCNSDMITTLIVKHLPNFISNSTELQNAYFKPYKAIGVRFMQSPSMQGFAFLDFPSRETAETAYEQLKTINFGLYYKQVVVEYAKPDPHRQQPSSYIILTTEQHEQAAVPVSAAQGLVYPSNPHLRYFYPDPTPEILNNITHAIGTVPRFYTQVLHLMNKYNMPPPFGPAEEESQPSLLKRKQDNLLASDESELEDEEVPETFTDNSKAQEEKIKQARLARITAAKQKQAITSSSKSHNQKKIKINISSNADNSNSVLTEEQKQIKAKCMPMAELSNLPAFKNYQPGPISLKLYVKNLSKLTTQEDLENLFHIFSKDAVINLMVKGKLRGQAFVTFPDEATASMAIECINGYMLNEKPMAVLYSKML